MVVSPPLTHALPVSLRKFNFPFFFFFSPLTVSIILGEATQKLHLISFCLGSLLLCVEAEAESEIQSPLFI